MAPAVTVMLFDVELPLHPEGNVQLYDVAPETDDMEYVCDEPEQTLALPLIVPGCAGKVVTVTLRLRVELVPQLLLAATETEPLLPEVINVMLFVVEVPVHPDGLVHT